MAFTIKIPANLLPKTIKFKEDEKVDWSKKNLKETFETELNINVIEELGIAAKDIFKHIKVSIGDKLEQGDLMAEKSSFFSKNKISAPEKAEVRSINHVEGSITLVTAKAVDIPFILDAQYLKKNKQDYLFSVNNGIEYEVNYALDNTFGGNSSYVKDEVNLNIEECADKVVVNELSSIISAAKIAALDPIALVAYQSEYHKSEVIQLIIKNKPDWTDLLKQKWPMCLYLKGSRTIYFYQP